MKSKTYGRNISSNGHKIVPNLPRIIDREASYWIKSPNGKREFTHPLFKFPAKFHPPIVKWALDVYYKNGKVLDPFAGSGTVQVESIANGISSIGIDIDPLAVFISKVKTTPLNPKKLEEDFVLLQKALSSFINSHKAQEQTPGGDITKRTFEKEILRLNIPPMPNIAHWFRLYVIVDLARILSVIENVEINEKSRLFFRACFAAIIRRVSNAEPRTVSGLEVTKIQANINKTRKINVYSLFLSKVHPEIRSMADLWNALKGQDGFASAKIIHGDVIDVLNKRKSLFQDVSLIITSPPYCRAVEYSRRHYLEMYWLGLVDNQAEQISLTHSYIGRKLVRLADWDEKIIFDITKLDKTIRAIESIDAPKGRTVKHYFYSMDRFFETLSNSVPNSTNVICVVGNSVCSKIPIDTSSFISALASRYFGLKNQFSYAIQNHHMQYGLWNGDGIKQEHVLILKSK